MGTLGYVAIIWALLKMDIPALPPAANRGSAIASFNAGIRFVAGSPIISTLLVMALAANLFGRAFQGIMPAVAEEILHVGESELSLLISLMGIGALTGGFLLAAMASTEGQMRLMLGGLFVFAASVIGMAVSPIYAFSLGLMFVIGVSSTFFSSSLRSTIQLQAPGHMQGRVMSLWTVMFLGMGPLGGLFLGMVADGIGLTPALTIMNLIGLGIVLTMAFSRRVIRERI